MSARRGELDWKLVRTHLERVMDLDPSQRDAALQDLQAQDTDLSSRVRSLLERAASPALSADQVQPLSSLAKELGLDAAAPSGSMIGRYSVVRVLGHGGMGSVYEAHDPALDRSVAIKVINPAVISGHTLRRFEHEALLLARLRHPAIAQVYETGWMPGSQPEAERVPFIAMEFVPEARMLTSYADEQGLDFPGRIALMLGVLGAIQHAHQRGVIHRDLKPANILVDGAGHPKVIDFGIGHSREAASLATLTGRAAGTLGYMSPEQCMRGMGDGSKSGSEADARSDVYALGVILYELLEGKSPYPSAERGSFGSMVDDLRFGRLLPAALAMIPNEPARREVRAVLARAMACDPGSRYPTAAALAEDLERVQRHEPVAARPRGAWQDARLFARRNRALVIACAAVLLSLSIGAVSATIGLVQARRAQAIAEQQTTRANRIANFFRNTIRSTNASLPRTGVVEPLDRWLSGPDTWLRPRATGEGARVVDVLSSAAAQLPKEFADDPLAHAQIAMELAGTFGSLYRLELAIDLARTAYGIRLSMLPPDDEDVLRAQTLLAFLLPAGPEQLDLLRGVLTRAERRFGRSDQRVMLLRSALVECLLSLEHAPEARTLLERFIQESDADLGPDSDSSWTFRLSRGQVNSLDPATAERGRIEAGEALAALQRLNGPESYQVARANSILARAYAGVDDDRAEQLYKTALGLNERLSGPASGGAYEMRGALQGVLLRRRKLAEAEQIAREQARYACDTLGDDAFAALKAKALLARILVWENKDINQAEVLARDASRDSLAYDEKIPSGDYPAYFRAIWAGAIRLKGDPKGAEDLVRPLIAARVGLNWGVWVDGFLWLQLGESLTDQGRFAEAAQAFQTSGSFLGKLAEADHPMRLNLQDSLARLKARASGTSAATDSQSLPSR